MKAEGLGIGGPVGGPESPHETAREATGRDTNGGGEGGQNSLPGENSRLVSQNEILGKRLLSEIALSKMFGVSRAVLRLNRIEGEWFKTGRTVYWRKNGALAIAKKLGCVLADGTGSEPINEPENKELGQVEVFRVVRKCVNPLVLMAQRTNGDVVTVRVTHSRNFLPGMELRAELREYGWTSHGRTPRFMGRW